MTDWTAYGHEVEELRTTRGWSQADLGKRADVSQSTIRDVEAATAKNGPHPLTVAGIQRAFGHEAGQAGHDLTVRYVGKARADWNAQDTDTNLAALIGGLPPERRDVLVAALRDLLDGSDGPEAAEE